MKIIVALDNIERNEILKFTDKVYDYVDGFKINHTLWDFPEDIARHKEFFIDCKLWDTPNTLKVVLNRILEKGATMATISTHNSQSAMNAVSEYREDIKLLGVTYLTSWTEGDQLSITGEGLSNMWKRAIMQMHSNEFSGMICSAVDLKLVKKVEDEYYYLEHLYPIDVASERKLLKVCPGITIEKNVSGQVRTTSPKQAQDLGADYIVIGRGITASKNPIDTLKEIKKSLKKS